VCWPSGYHVADANCSDVPSAAARRIADPSCGRRERRPIRASPAHVKENAVALSLALTPEELHALDAAHPPPDH
jgi:hypothetical protein